MNQLEKLPKSDDILKAYIENGKDLVATASYLNITLAEVAEVISKPSSIMVLNKDNGLFAKMEELLESKMLELEEAEIATSKDPVEIIKLMHSMKMEELKLQIKLAEVQHGNKGPTKVSNTQVNIGSEVVTGLPAILQAIKE